VTAQPAQPTPAAPARGGEEGRSTSWVELYLDLVFVLAMGQLAELIVDKPDLGRVFGTLGLFVMLWWTWIGFAVLYNRADADGRIQRLLFLVASAPVAAAAVATASATHGHSTPFIVSLAVTRVVLGAARAPDDDPATDDFSDRLRRRTGLIYFLSAGLLTVSIWVPAPFRYVLWGLAVAQESGAMFLDLDRLRERMRGRSRRRSGRAPDPEASTALDSHHFAERFGLFIIILLGELFLQAGEAAADGRTPTFSSWASLIAAAVLGASLWWAYFDATADFDLRVLERSGGSPTTARAIFAVGHMLPAFALLLTASGVGLLSRQDPPSIAYKLCAVGAGIYLTSTRAGVRAEGRRARASISALVLCMYFLPVLRHHVDPTAYLWIVAAWSVLAAGLASTLPLRSLEPQPPPSEEGDGLAPGADEPPVGGEAAHGLQ
jgi:low temperature requirement protein LtrA